MKKFADNQTPLVSVVLCVFNGENVVASAIDDILAQTYGNIELIISDDASTDRTSEIIAKYNDDSRIRLFRQPVNIGFLANKNFAIGQARGEFITQQDHDDRSHPDRIARQVNTLQKTGMLLAACGVRHIDQYNNEIRRICPERDLIIDSIPDTGLPFFFPPIMFSRTVWQQHGPFNEYFAGVFGEDNYFVSCVLRSHPIAVISDCLYDYVDTGCSVTSRLRTNRALTMVPILYRLAEQNQLEGTNDLEQGRFDLLLAMEKELLCDRPYISEQYRVFAARAIDHSDLVEGARLLGKAVVQYPISLDLIRTALYWLRRTLARSK